MKTLTKIFKRCFIFISPRFLHAMKIPSGSLIIQGKFFPKNFHTHIDRKILLTLFENYIMLWCIVSRLYLCINCSRWYDARCSRERMQQLLSSIVRWMIERNITCENTNLIFYNYDRIRCCLMLFCLQMIYEKLLMFLCSCIRYVTVLCHNIPCGSKNVFY